MFRIAVVSALAGVTGMAGVAVAATAPSASNTPASIMVFDQAAKDQKIGVKYIYLPENGYAAVYRSDDSGRPSGEAIGYAKLLAGDHRDVRIELKDGPAAGEKLWVTLYRDGDDAPEFSPGKGDVALWSVDQKPWEHQFEIR